MTTRPPIPHDSHLLAPLVLLALLLASVLIHAPHTLFDVADTNLDFFVHYNWAVQFLQALHGGDPYPRWMPLANFGVGEPALMFYSPLFYYATALVGWFTDSTWAAIKIVEVLSTTIAGWFAWRLLRLFCGPGLALVGAVACQAAPMVFMLFHYFNGLPWASSFAALAALAYYTFRPQERDQWLDIPVALAVAALTLTHTVSALMALITMTFHLVVFVRREHGRWRVAWRPVAAWFLSVAAGLGLSMVYFYPAVRSMGLINADVWIQNYTPFDAFAFSTVTWLVFGIRWFSFQWVVPGVSLLGVLFATAWVYRRGGVADATGRALLGMLAVSWASLFIASELSYPLWVVETPLRKVQFPHRFLYITAITAPVVCLICLREALDGARSRLWVWAGAAPLVAGLALTAALAMKMILVDGKALELERDNLRGYAGLAEYRLDTLGPQWRDYTDRGGFAVECERLGMDCLERQAEGRTRSWLLTTTQAVEPRLPVFYFPAWSLSVNGNAVATRPDPATGLLLVRLPPGQHQVNLTWAGLPQERIGLWISLLTLALLLGLKVRRAWSTQRILQSQAR